jgi:hypothetical protein
MVCATIVVPMPLTTMCVTAPSRYEQAHLMVENGERIARLSKLQDDWDGEGAAAPSLEAMRRANAAIHWALKSGFVVTDVDADVLGGVGVVVRASPISAAGMAWIACMNDGSDTFVLSKGTEVCGHAAWDADRAKRTISDFLTSDRRAAQA